MKKSNQSPFKGNPLRSHLAGMTFKLLLCISLLPSSRCSSPIASEQEIPYQVDSLINVFKLEALKRGIVLNTSREELKVVFGELGTKGGSCRPNDRPKLVTLDALAWKLVSIQAKEMLLFHELAHCLIGRHHDNERLSTGECKSWMRESDKVCMINVVNRDWRDYYLNELFSKSKNVPAWFNPDHPPAAACELLSSVPLKGNRVHLPDSLMFLQTSTWRAVLDLPDIGPNGYLSLQINEYSLEFSYIHAWPGHPATRHETIMLNQFKTPEHNTFTKDEYQRTGCGRRIVIEKLNSAVYVFFDETLKLCIPIQPGKFRLQAFTNFPDNELMIEFYRVKEI
ncbi:hypothetical protein WBG78_07855 [Chryseolinea sp. T2]|uniref:hypothetical protein n=1 Tax=Chryseolinea sp. T2 TaxID=3129255 RepID=UPI003076F81F